MVNPKHHKSLKIKALRRKGGERLALQTPFFRAKIKQKTEPKRDCFYKPQKQSQKMGNSLKIKYYCRESKCTKDGTSKIECSLTLNKERVIITLPLRTTPKDFKRSKTVKNYLDSTTARINVILAEAMAKGLTPTSRLISNVLINGWEKPKTYTINDLFKDFFLYLDERDRAGELTLTNYEKYERTRDAFLATIDSNRGADTIKESDINHFRLVLKLQGKQESTIGQYLTKLKTVVLFGMNNGKITVNPFYTIKIKKCGTEETIRYLTEEELNTLRNHDFVPRLNKIRDLFLFVASTGLSYSDLKNLKPEDIKDGTIKKERVKTGIYYTVPVLPEAEAILTKYNGCLPVPSNVKYNAYLKEIGDICNIDKNLTTHTARHTYATRLLNKGVSLEVVSRALGHSNSAMTRHYARLLDTTCVSEIRNKMAV